MVMVMVTAVTIHRATSERRRSHGFVAMRRDAVRFRSRLLRVDMRDAWFSGHTFVFWPHTK